MISHCCVKLKPWFNTKLLLMCFHSDCALLSAEFTTSMYHQYGQICTSMYHHGYCRCRWSCSPTSIELYWICPVWHPRGCLKKLEIFGENQTLCIHNCILNIEEQKSETDQESLNVVKRCSTDFRTPWNPGRPPPQMFKVYIVSRWIWAIYDRSDCARL